MNNKRGLSEVVSTTLILLITVAAAALLISFIMPFVQNGLSKSSECLPYRDTFKFDGDYHYNCYDPSNLHGLTIRANMPEKEAGMPTKFSLVLTNENGDSQRVDVVNGSAASNSVGGVRLLDRTQTAVMVPRVGEVQTFVYTGSVRYTKAEIYPVSPNGKICERNDVVELQLCKGVTLTP